MPRALAGRTKKNSPEFQGSFFKPVGAEPFDDSAPVWKLEGKSELGREDSVSDLVADISERGGSSIEAYKRSASIKCTLIVAGWRRTRRRRVVEYIVDIHTEVEALAFHDFDVFA
jgi:hypothetical protein